MSPDRLMLLDTASLYFRAFFGVPDTIRAPDGSPVNAVRGLLDMIARLITDHRPTRLVACWDDDWRPAFRVAALPSYKAHRLDEDGGSEQTPAALDAQVPVIVDVLAALGIARVGCPGYEADDVIATLVQQEIDAGTGTPVDVVTGDRDLFQLVDDEAGVRVLYTVRGLKDLEVVDRARLAERHGVADGPAYADMSILRGDPSDGLPGVPGIGEKTAAGLLARYGDLDALEDAAARGDRGLTLTQRIRVTGAAEYLAAARTVVLVARDAPVPPTSGALPQSPADPDLLDELAERWNLRSPVDRVLEALQRR